MPLRDIATTLFIVYLIFRILKEPWIGVVAYAWVSVFQPHKHGWGFAVHLPFAMAIALVTFLSMINHQKDWKLPHNGITIHLILLALWMSLTTVFALEQELAWRQWNNVMKVWLFTLV